VEVDTHGLIKRFFRPKVGDSFQPISKSGVHIFEPKVLRFIPKKIAYSLEKELIPDLLARGEQLYAYNSDRYARDMGTPDRLAQVRRDYAQGRISI
jgi:NDP-sugar pyrophosphorylase family protein